ncbi:MAG: hypothetical protein LBM00_06885 [Deltaproteobacteria bacterium]|nr:hypothetical protein [Deltaproteobacteria bacterium]
MVIDAELLQILACPVCRGDLEALRAEGAAEGADPCGLACTACSVVYPVRDGIPVMLKEEAVKRGEWDKTVPVR